MGTKNEKSDLEKAVKAVVDVMGAAKAREHYSGLVDANKLRKCLAIIDGLERKGTPGARRSEDPAAVQKSGPPSFSPRATQTTW